MFVLITPIRVDPEYRDRYVESLKGNISTSLRTEPGCLRFEAIQDARDPDVVWLHEVFTDETSFDSHMNTPHLVGHLERTKDWTEVLSHGAGRGASYIWPPDDEWK